jgi:hypothetical protein
MLTEIFNRTQDWVRVLHFRGNARRDWPLTAHGPYAREAATWYQYVLSSHAAFQILKKRHRYDSPPPQ